jgi:hypothetical protein
VYVTDCTVNSIQRNLLHSIDVIGLSQGCTVFRNINAILASNAKCTITIYSVCIMYDMFLFPEFLQIILYDVMEWE